MFWLLVEHNRFVYNAGMTFAFLLRLEADLIPMLAFFMWNVTFV